jgi:hypothetical protein
MKKILEFQMNGISFVTSHGKSVYDALEGAIKSQAARMRLQQLMKS